MAVAIEPIHRCLPCAWPEIRCADSRQNIGTGRDNRSIRLLKRADIVANCDARRCWRRTWSASPCRQYVSQKKDGGKCAAHLITFPHGNCGATRGNARERLPRNLARKIVGTTLRAGSTVPIKAKTAPGHYRAGARSECEWISARVHKNQALAGWIGGYQRRRGGRRQGYNCLCPCKIRTTTRHYGYGAWECSGCGEIFCRIAVVPTVNSDCRLPPRKRRDKRKDER